ncbi:double zinc ribbon and ankyrin repeat-containing protein 1-like [Ptychodera flava]|uniref:double zinc ribbon and ankyrin repeat-containing protein 1-like n=1 Tax=Ptychodera flava TaxID=63121 RepID=UPI003969F192
MSAGAIATPLIVPLRPPLLGTTSSHIDTNTFIEIKSETPGVEVFYTTNGTKPDPFQRVLNKTTLKYKRPFVLREGKRTIKALAVTKNGLHESQIVTKTFQVDPAVAIPEMENYRNLEDNDRNFQFAYNKSSIRPRSRSPPVLIGRPRSRSPSPVLRRSSDLALDIHRLHLHESTQGRTADSGFHSTPMHNGYDSIGQAPVSNTIAVPVYPTTGMGPMDRDFLNKQVVMSSEYPSRKTVADPQYWINGRPFQTSTQTSMAPAPVQSWEGPIALPLHTFEKQSIGTQTTGLVFPTPEQVYRMRSEVEELNRLRQELRRIKEAEKPQLEDVSVGRGFWQKQVTHICGHIKAFTEENAEFRAAIAEPKLTRIIGAAVEDERDEFSITVTFRKVHTPDNVVSRPCNTHKHPGGTVPRLFATREREYHSDDGSVYSVRSTDSHQKPRRKVTRRNKRRPVVSVRKRHASEERERSHEEKLAPEERLLLKELGPSADGRPEEVQHLLDEGADPNVKNNDGYPALALAVLNSHTDCIPVLVEADAKINAKFGPRDNTVLHEAVLRGPKAKRAIQVLLECKANPQIQNYKGMTAYDLAVKAGHDSIAKMFASSVGFSLMDRITRKYSDVQKHRKELDLEGF